MANAGFNEDGSIPMEHIIHSEILAVTSAMRRNYRWASFAGKRVARDAALANTMGLRRAGTYRMPSEHKRERQEAELWASFESLKRKARDAEDVRQLPLLDILDPFLALIRSPLSTGPITSVSLNSLMSFLEVGLISLKSKGLRPALAEISNALATCKFEASDVSSDEVVTLRIITLIRECILKDVGSMLGDFEVCEMIEPILTTCCQMKLSEILRRSASASMHALARKIFSKLKQIDPSKYTLMNGEGFECQLSEITLSSRIDRAEPGTDDRSETLEQGSVAVDGENSPQISPLRTVSEEPFGLPAITELLRVLINLLDPSDKEHPDSTRLIALSILNTVFEVSGFNLGRFPALRTMIIDRGCKFLFLLARSENQSILYLSLRVISAMLESMRSELKLQQELFISFTLDRLVPPPPGSNRTGIGNNNKTLSPSPNIPSTPTISNVPEDAASDTSSMPSARPIALPAKGETRELLLQTLNHLCRSASFMVDLYMNYDCDINCENLLERLIAFATKAIYPSHYTGGLEYHQQSSQALCLDLILTFVQHMARRAEGDSDAWPPSMVPSPDTLLHDKSQKQLILTGALRFNTKPKVGITFLEENKLIYADDLPRSLSLAKFLRTCPRLDKKLLGDFLSRPENLDVLEQFMGLLDFEGTPIAEAMRNLLESFRLPGESQQIARITETFASKYFATGPEVIKTEDAVYVLAYSIIMLNTDLHNPQVRKRMTLEDYQRNLRGVNDGSDFPAVYLQAIYDSIRKREIVMPEEHIGQVGFEYAWKELLSRSQKSGKLIMRNTSRFDQHIFKLVWKQVISALGFAFTYYDDDYVVQRAISGLQQCAKLASGFRMPEVFDHIVFSVSPTTGLLDVPTSQTFNYPTAQAEGQTLSISPLSVHFGGNLKGQLAAVVLFRLVNGNADTLSEGWKQIIEIYLNLFLHSMLPSTLLQKEEFLGGTSAIPLQGAINSPKPIARPEAGLLSALSSYLMTPYGSASDPIVPQATEKEIENTLCAVDCITACRIDEFYSEIMGLGRDTLMSVLGATRALLDARVEEHLTDADAHSQKAPSYDPGVVFLLELMLSGAMQGGEHIQDLWPIVFGSLQDILSRAISYSTLLVERAVVGLIRLCSALVNNVNMRDHLFIALDVLGSLPSIMVIAVGDQIMSGVMSLLRGRENLVKSSTEWTIVTNLMRNTISHSTASRHSFIWLDNFLSGESSTSVSKENFIPLMNILQEYAELTAKTPSSKGSATRQAPESLYEEPTKVLYPRLITPSSEGNLERGCRAIELLFSLRTHLPTLYDASVLSSSQVWNHYSLPLLVALARQCTNPHRELRHAAITNLQRILLGPSSIILGVDPRPTIVEDVFNQVLFPLVDDLLKPDVIHRDPTGMTETRVRACSLLCRAFLQYEIQPNNEIKDVQDIWLQLLDMLEHLMSVSKRDPLYEAVPETLKNVALVMYASEYLIPPARGDDSRSEMQKEIWSVTHERLQRFLPGFLNDVLGRSQSQKSPPVQTLPQPPQSPMPTGASTPLKPKTNSIL